MLFETPVMFAAALVAALVITLVRKGLLAVVRPDAGTAANDGRAVAFRGPAPSQDEAQGKSLYLMVSICLIVIVALFDVTLAGPAVRSAARLLGFSPLVTTRNLPNHDVLIGTVTVLLLWVQLGHFLRLRSVWTRTRFVGLVVSVPLVLRALLWLGVSLGIHRGVLPGRSIVLAASWAEFFAIGVVPFAVPAIHGRLFGPAATWLGDRIRPGFREAAEYLGNAILFAGVIALVVVSSQVYRPLSGASLRARSSAFTPPVPSGMPHICMNDYPAAAQRAREQGVTIVSYTITTMGTVKDVTVERSSGSTRLDEAAVECVTRWTYLPATKHGRQVDLRSAAKIVWLLR